MAEQNELDLITPEELEEWIKVPKATQAAMRSRRQIPFVLLAPKTPRYRRSAIVAWLEERSVLESK